MNSSRLIIRVVVVLVSLFLTLGYVYVRARGGFSTKPAPAPNAFADLEQIPVSKALPGSKSTSVLLPEEIGLPAVAQSSANVEGDSSSQPSPPANPSGPTADLIIYSTKSAPVFLPADAAPDPPQPMLPGSKSRAVFLPDDFNGPPGTTAANRQQR